MKFIWAFLLFVTSSSSFAFVSYESKWIPKKSYVLNTADKDVLIVAKSWASSHYNVNKEKYDFEYSVRKLDAGFRLEITPLHIGLDGKYLYMIDGEMCLDLNRGRKVVLVYQCSFPPLEALQRH
ncbi:hypothetical protein [Undibacterium rivi]|uniref:hypothetical protein n=1 Tax=Undibacterium rivi TaxID=2828729 RepID=UPI001BAE6483|nr:hypothetical protein [Undibacterium rivi]